MLRGIDAGHPVAQVARPLFRRTMDGRRMAVSTLFSTLGAFVLLAEMPAQHGLWGAVLASTGLIATRGCRTRLGQSCAQKGICWGCWLIALSAVMHAYSVKVLAIAPVVLDWDANMGRLGMLLPMDGSCRAQAIRAVRRHWHLAWARWSRCRTAACLGR